LKNFDKILEKKFENTVFLELLRNNNSNLSDNSIYFKKILTREISFFDEINNCDIQVEFKLEEKSKKLEKIIKNLNKPMETSLGINKKIIYFEKNFEENLENFSELNEKNFINFKNFFL
jgi:hypothetical protein